MIAGVAGGIADYFDLDPVLVRLMWVVACLVGIGTGALAYLLFWIVMPARPRESADVSAAGAFDEGRGMDASLLFGIVLVAGGALPDGGAATSPGPGFGVQPSSPVIDASSRAVSKRSQRFM